MDRFDKIPLLPRNNLVETKRLIS